MSEAKAYVKTICGILSMKADELFENFDNFCQLDEEDSPQKRRHKNILTRAPVLNVELLEIFNVLAYDEIVSSPRKIRTQKIPFSDYLDKFDIDSPKRIKYTDDSFHYLANKKYVNSYKDILCNSQDDNSIFKLEKTLLLNENDSINYIFLSVRQRI